MDRAQDQATQGDGKDHLSHIQRHSRWQKAPVDPLTTASFVNQNLPARLGQLAIRSDLVLCVILIREGL